MPGLPAGPALLEAADRQGEVHHRGQGPEPRAGAALLLKLRAHRHGPQAALAGPLCLRQPRGVDYIPKKSGRSDDAVIEAAAAVYLSI